MTDGTWGDCNYSNSDLFSVRRSQGFSGGSCCGGRSRHNSGVGLRHNGGLLSSGEGRFGDADAGFFSNNEKCTMQNLNDRLASYLNSVQSLEKENAYLERVIGERYKQRLLNQSHVPKDCRAYYEEINKLIGELISETADVNKINLDIQNIKMTANDIKLKYQAECGLRQTVEADLQNLHGRLNEVTLEKSDLEMQYKSLKEELTDLKKDVQEAMTSLQHQFSGDVTVEVNSGPGLDLRKKLNDLRHEYEQIIEKNHQEMEEWYNTKVAEVRQQENSISQETDCSDKPVMDLDRQYQALDIERQSQLSILQSLKSNLINTEGSYNMQLQHLEDKIEPVEAELANIKGEIQSQNQEYRTLLGIKTCLEREIHQYRQLLEKGKQLVASQGGCGEDKGSGTFGGISGAQKRGQSCDGIMQGRGGQSYGGGGRQSCDGILQGGRGGQSYSGGGGQCQSSCQAQSGSCSCCRQQGYS